MYSSSSDSDSSSSSYDDRRSQYRRSYRSKSSKSLRSSSLFENDNDISPLRMKDHIHDERPRSYRKKHSSSSTKRDSISSRSKQIKREHDKELKKVLKFLENESSLLNGEEDKKEELYQLKKEHKSEVKHLFKFLKTELTSVTEKHARKQADLEDRLETIKVEARKEVKRYKDHSLQLEEELLLVTQKSMKEVKKNKDECSMAMKEASSLNDEVQRLRKQIEEQDKIIADKNKRIQVLEVKNKLVEDLRDDCRRKDEEIQRKDRALIQKNAEIRSANSKSESSQVQISWEEASGLTNDCDFENDAMYIEKPRMMNYREKQLKHGRLSTGTRKTSYSTSPKRRENRDDIESSSDRKTLSVSFSDEVEQRMLPLQARHENLSRRLEQMYLNK